MLSGLKLYYPLMKDAFWPSDGAQRVLFMDDPNAFLGRVLKGRERAQRGVPCSERRLPTMKSLKAVFLGRVLLGERRAHHEV